MRKFLLHFLCVSLLLACSGNKHSALNEAKTASEIYDLATPSVVTIICYDKNHVPLSQGSGFFIAEDTIVTNFHVVDGSYFVEYKFINNSEMFRDATVVLYSEKYDLAKILTKSKHSKMDINTNGNVKVGSVVYALGNPQGLEGSLSEGIISAVRKEDNLIQTTAAISHGSSGGPLINQNGEVIGVSSLSIRNGQNLNFAIPIEHIKQCSQVFSKGNKIITLNNNKQDIEIKSFQVETEDMINNLCRITTSIKNCTNDNIRNLTGVLIFYDTKDGEMVDYKEFVCEDEIVSGFSKLIKIIFDRSSLRNDTGFPLVSDPFGFSPIKRDGNTFHSHDGYSSIEIRILSYDMN